MTHQTKIGLIADDFTGALDSGAQFAKVGLSTRLAFADVGDGEVEIINTGSREVTEAEAARRCADAAGRLRGRALFKKIDSTLRGHIGAEIAAVLQAAGMEKALVCPAAPRQGRVVRDGLLYVSGVPLADSAFRNDPVYPAHTSLVAQRVGRHSAHLPLGVVRGPLGGLAEAIRTASPGVITADALVEEDLYRLSQALAGQPVLPCGAFGLAYAWAQVLAGGALQGGPGGADAFQPNAEDPVLVVAGSANPATHRQVEALAGHAESLVLPLHMPLTLQAAEGVLAAVRGAWSTHRVIVLCPALKETVREAHWLRFGHSAAELAARLLAERRPSVLVVVGGETANHLCAALHVQAVQLLGEAAPGVAHGLLAGGTADGLKVVAKAGGFGDPQCLEKLLYSC